MRSSRRYRLHLERSTSVGDIGSSFKPGPCIDEDYIPTTVAREKFRPQPAIMKPSQTTNTGLNDSKPAERSNVVRPSQDPRQLSQNSGNRLQRAMPAVVESLSCVSAVNSKSKDKEQRSTRSRPPVIEGIFFFGSPERELSTAKKIDEDDELELFGEFIEKCTLCNKKFEPDKDVYMYKDRPFCSSDCRDDQIALDGFKRKDFGLGKDDQKTMMSLRKDLNRLQEHL
ncbi:hypothetical protein ACJRO7_011101 [Eucalyptus globulus]|uniref:FLZ-type domain-containing protein n=1 Tax=Eucalyptus globulus TaxID=34317 RepID=A0ABD3LE23_EUCGL